MEVKLTEQNYDDFVKARFVSGSFLQSSIWQDFLKEQKLNFWQVAIVDQNETLATCLLYEIRLPASRSYLYAPKGPVFSSTATAKQKQEALAWLLSKIRDITISTRQRKEVFFKSEPSDEGELVSGMIKSHDLQPRDTWVLDLDKDLKKMLANMHAKTRYNIALARKKGVKVRFSTNKKDLQSFLSLMRQTSRRNKISIHSNSYYEALFNTLVRHKAGEFCLAEVDGKIVAANMIIRFGKAVTYLHGASDYQHRSYMAPHLLQWETIKQSVDLGYAIYDFWGIAPEDGSKSGWSGISRFKKNFGGRAIKSPGAHNFIYDKTWYGLYNIARKILKK